MTRRKLIPGIIPLRPKQEIHLESNLLQQIRFDTTNSNGVIGNKTEHKNDSLGKKSLLKEAAPAVKATTPDSLQGKDVKKSETKNKSNNRKRWLDLYASPDFPFVSPHESEPSKLSYTIGIKLNRSFGEHFSIKTGIQYSRLNIVETDSGLSTVRLNLC